jgi:hypothetical protein
MRRVFFKKEMRQAILDGKKVSTTRDHPIPLGRVLAVSGSRFKAEPFAVLEIQDRIPTKIADVTQLFYREEGFTSPEEMAVYAEKNKLLQTDNQVWYHRFKITEVMFASRAAKTGKLSSASETRMS